MTREVSALVRMRSRWAIAVAAALALVPADHAFANDGDRQSYEARLTSKHPGIATGLHLGIDYVNPANPAGKPHAVKEVVIRLPRGAQINTTLPVRCSASDPQLMLVGSSACPSASKVGDGALSVDTGLPLPVGSPLPRVLEARTSFFNNGDELILVAETVNTPVPLRIASRFSVGPRTFTSTVPPLPGVPPPDPFLAIDTVENRVDGPSNGAPYITTPAHCPKVRRWRMSASFTYRDGVEQTERVTTPCRRG